MKKRHPRQTHSAVQWPSARLTGNMSDNSLETSVKIINLDTDRQQNVCKISADLDFLGSFFQPAAMQPILDEWNRIALSQADVSPPRKPGILLESMLHLHVLAERTTYPLQTVDDFARFLECSVGILELMNHLAWRRICLYINCDSKKGEHSNGIWQRL